MEITGYEIRHFAVPLDRSIGDSQIDPIDNYELAYLELETDVGLTGIGIDGVNFGGDVPLLQGYLATQFNPLGEDLCGKAPAALLHRQSRGRGGQYGDSQFTRMIDFALWDLVAKHHDLPLYELLGASEAHVDAYASGLAFHHDSEATRRIYQQFADRGFVDAKVKVGFDTIEEDIERLQLVDEVFDGCRRLMADANEAFSPKEAIRRVRAYADAGFDLYWIEDPATRTDIEGVQRVADALTDTHLNGGEYVDLVGKRELLEARAVDILNVHGISSGQAAATIAHTYGVPLSVGNTPADLGAHIAAALPECRFVESSMSSVTDLLSDGIEFNNGQAILPKTPGHGIALDESVATQYEQQVDAT